MNKSIFIIAVSLLFAVGTAVGRPAPDKKTRYIVLAEQARHYVAIADAATQRIVWTWDVSKSGLPAEHRNWFNCPTEIKPVYGGLCILASPIPTKPSGGWRPSSLRRRISAFGRSIARR